MRHRAIAVVLVLLAGIAVYAKKKNAESAQWFVQLPKDQRALHALNRLTFGPRPGDVQRVEGIGLKKWIGQQLHPERIRENPELESRLQPLASLRMTTAELVENYPPPQIVKQMVEGRLPLPSDPERRMTIERLVRRYRQKRNANVAAAPQDTKPTLETIGLTADAKRVVRVGTPDQKLQLFDSLDLDRQYDLLEAMPQAARLQLYTVAPPELRRKLREAAGPVQAVTQDLIEGKLLGAVYGNRQLQEVLTDFWYNHFNVFLDKGADRFLVTAYERDAIRPHVLGKFKDLLLATAQSPAMLFYLDNVESVAVNSRPARMAANRPRRGLNENYARELMELHTLGVDGGYTQRDVTEVARCFTGWTVRGPARGGGFEFNAKLHDNGEKTVLGTSISKGGGINDGLKVLDILAHAPATSRYISKALAIRFVSDNPPPSLIEKMAKTFRNKDGDLRQVMKTMLDAPEFWSQAAWSAKMKSPFEMVASSVRALDASVDFGFALAQQLNQLGEPLYRKQEPTGYTNSGREWVNSADLLARMNFAMALAGNRIPGVHADLSRFGGGADLVRIAHELLMTDLSAQARDAIEKGLQQQTGTPQVMAGLTLGSPDFQHR